MRLLRANKPNSSIVSYLAPQIRYYINSDNFKKENLIVYSPLLKIKGYIYTTSPYMQIIHIILPLYVERLNYCNKYFPFWGTWLRPCFQCSGFPVVQSLILCVLFCQPLLYFLCFLLQPLHCLSFIDFNFHYFFVIFKLFLDLNNL